MKLKRFSAPDMRQAMALVRDQLGPDAVIVANKTTTEGVEITVAIEDAEEIEQSKNASVVAPVIKKPIAVISKNRNDQYVTDKRLVSSSSSRSVGRSLEFNHQQKKTSEENSSTKQKSDIDLSVARETIAENSRMENDYEISTLLSDQAEVRSDRDEIFDQVKMELQSLRTLIQAQMSSNAVADAIRTEPQKYELLKNLLEMSFSPQFIRRVIAGANARDNSKLMKVAMSLIGKWLSIYPGDILDNGGIVALVGPTGVGKTTTIAKLAAKFVMRHGKNQLALINLDSYRIGAYENLKIYGRILGVPARNASNATELKQILRENYDKKLILIDTSGIGQRDGRIDDIGCFFNDEIAGVKTCLVLAANVAGAVLRETIQKFHPRQLSGVILTKIDETAALGSALGELISQKLPLVYITDGQRVPEDLHRADSENIIEYTLSLWKQNRQWLEKESVEMMAGGFAQHVEER